jgi:hypothetical protein
LLYFFTSELSVEVLNELKNNLTKAKNATTEVWVYKKSSEGDKLVLINDNQPSFTSKIKASMELGISNKKLTKILDTLEWYKDLIFYPLATL